MNIKSKKMIIIALLIILLISVAIVVYAEDSSPGSETDPLVTKSYVDSQISKIQTKNTGTTGSTQEYNVLELSKDSKIFGKEGTEFILRSGSAEAISGSDGDGLADLTSDVKSDYFTGQDIPENRILLVSRDDGRGIIITSNNTFVVVRGGYTLEETNSQN